MRHLALASVLILLLSLCSCKSSPGGVKECDGDSITPLEIESMFEEIADGNSGSGESITLPDGEDRYMIVYWTKNGSVYHLTSECSIYVRSSEKLNGTLENAIKTGKNKPCSACLNENNADNDNEKETVKPSEGDNVYDIP